MSEQKERLRTHPDERFAGDSHIFDLQAALQQLRAEAREGQRGHRQVTIFHRASVTQVLFAFEAGGALAEHAANGLVTIQVIEGQLAVEAAGQRHDLAASQMLVLAPQVRHSVRANESAAMLLTVHLEREK